MAADIIYLADRRGDEPEIERFRQQIAERKAFHDEYELHMRSAFQVVKARRPGVMDHLRYEEFEEWLADRIMKRGRMRASRRRMEEREKTALESDDFRPF
jgi:hypothetical protein